MSSERAVIVAMVAERVARHVTAAPSEIQAIAEDVMTLFEVRRVAVGTGYDWITLTLAPVYPATALEPQRPPQGAGWAFSCSCATPFDPDCPVHRVAGRDV